MRRADFSNLPSVEREIEIDGRVERRAYVDYPSIGRAYAARVVQGLELACSYVVKACRKTLEMLTRAEDPNSYFYFSPDHVIDFCDFYEQMPHIEDGPWVHTGNPYQVLEPHLIWEFMHIYGFRRRRTHQRVTLRAYLEEPRKNVKSGRAAIVALYELIAPHQIGPQVLIGAATEKQANRVYGPCKTLSGGVESAPDQTPNPNMVVINDCAEEMRARWALDVNSVRIACGVNGGFITRVNSIGERNDGWNPSCVVLEELHAQNRDTLVHLWQQNMFGLLAEMQHDFALRKGAAVVRFNKVRWGAP